MSLVLVSLGLPLLKMQVSYEAVPPYPALDQVAMVIPETAKTLEEFVPPAPLTPLSNTAPIVKAKEPSTLLVIYWFGVAISLAIMVYQVLQLLYLIVFSKVRNDLGRLVISHRVVRYPFSFWKWTFLPKDFYYGADTWEIVNQHELAHQEQAHTLDLIILGLVRSLLWFNPVVYLLQKSVKENHEYLADQSVLKNHSLEDYGRALVAICLESPSMHLAHSFSLKSNLSKRIKNMKTKRTSVVRTGISFSLFLGIVMLVATQVSLYAQDTDLEKIVRTPRHFITSKIGGGSFSSVKVFAKTGIDPDQWLLLENEIFPLMLLERHRATLDKYVEGSRTDIKGQLDYQMYLRLGKTDDFEEADPFHHPLSERKAELAILLTEEERIAMYEMAKAWNEKYTHQVYPDMSILSELDFMEFKYLFFISEPSKVDPRKYGIKHTVDVSKVDQAPTPNGGMERFLKNVISESKIDASLKLEDLPKKVEFEFIIDSGGNLVMLKPVTKVRGTKEVADKVYAWLGQLNNNLIKVSEAYLWQPGRKKGVKVPTRMRLEIPKELL